MGILYLVAIVIAVALLLTYFKVDIYLTVSGVLFATAYANFAIGLINIQIDLPENRIEPADVNNKIQSLTVKEFNDLKITDSIGKVIITGKVILPKKP